MISGTTAVPKGTVAELAYPRIGLKLTDGAGPVWAECERLLLPSIGITEIAQEMGKPAKPQEVVVKKCTVDPKLRQTYLDIEPASRRRVRPVRG